MFDLRQLKKYQQKPQTQSKPDVVMDSANTNESKEEKTALDSSQDLNNRIAVFQEQQIASEAMALLDAWLNTDDADLDEDEGLGDRLYGLMVGLADENKDGELSDDESEVINVGLNAVADYLVEKGVSEENAIALLTDFDNELANNIRETVLSVIPDGDDEFYADMDKVVFADSENESVLDSALLDSVAEEHGLTLDASYRRTFAIRHGKKMRIRKRIAGKVRLTAKQRQAIKKAQRKAFTGAAKMKRLKSFRLRKRLGL
ncbi:MAG: hypothetical protein SPE06_08395 [[Actinobacillus] rossii]|nr:hypothetical protein [[Actinobacillus] rossii]MDY4506387.1 hypothetical protein [[Actinobacillus] rossii]